MEEIWCVNPMMHVNYILISYSHKLEANQLYKCSGKSASCSICYATRPVGRHHYPIWSLPVVFTKPFFQPSKPQGWHNSQSSIYVLDNGHVSDNVITAQSADVVTALHLLSGCSGQKQQLQMHNINLCKCYILWLNIEYSPNVDVAGWQSLKRGR